MKASQLSTLVKNMRTPLDDSTPLNSTQKKPTHPKRTSTNPSARKPSPKPATPRRTLFPHSSPLSAQESTLSSLRSTLRDATEDNDRLHGSICALREDILIGGMKRVGGEWIERIRVGERERRGLFRKIEMIKSDDGIKENSEKLDKEIGGQEERMERLRREIREMKTIKEELSDKEEQLNRRSLHSLSESNSHLLSTTTLNSTILSTRHDISTLDNKIATLRSSIYNTLRSLSDAQDDNEHHKAYIHNLCADIDNLQEMITIATKDLSARLLRLTDQLNSRTESTHP